VGNATGVIPHEHAARQASAVTAARTVLRPEDAFTALPPVARGSWDGRGARAASRNRSPGPRHSWFSALNRDSPFAALASIIVPRSPLGSRISMRRDDHQAFCESRMPDETRQAGQAMETAAASASGRSATGASGGDNGLRNGGGGNRMLRPPPHDEPKNPENVDSRGFRRARQDHSRLFETSKDRVHRVLIGYSGVAGRRPAAPPATQASCPACMMICLPRPATAIALAPTNQARQSQSLRISGMRLRNDPPPVT
jgi:hypothetical protein